MRKGIILIGMIALLFGIIFAGCTSEPSSITIDVYLTVIGHDASVTPIHQEITIGRETTKTITFYVHVDGAYSFFLDRQNCVNMYNNGWGGMVECPTFFDMGHNNTTRIDVKITTVTALPKEQQTVNILYDETGS